ncbi:TPA: ABC transporter permease [Klebsiella pneumoniae]|uniref:ABC transporter permease n=2 Tax=Enterobacterales TaxID=91347 RepID=A0A422ZW10_KLEPN|nr:MULTISPECIES: ABC transporter permease [Klebsiella]KUP98738.1 nickel ABC transporter permease [Enterobacter roggenkampii]MBJ8955917.1 ABC transporter permease [Citrobacter braakii]MBS6573320.1 ABC transporter permease [Klebsiella michiganensis]PJX61861.1 ABC transporter permease [Klebsiella sp. E-Nf3]ROE43578.1 ABC transporter permease [Klebsiella pneumoniae subsp. pneumoniae]HCB1006485.1 ABC transporter permease [Klebsiella variicola subsp. variicola]
MIIRRWQAAKLSPPAALGCLIIVLSLLIAFFPQWFAPYDPLTFDYRAILKPPSAAHWFGTDNFGRDMLTRVIYAWQVDMQIAFFTTLFPMFFGTVMGLIVGYYGGWLEVLFHRLVDAVITFPLLVLVIVIVAVLGPGLVSMYIAVGIIYWVFYARLISGEVSVQKRLDYVAAGKVMGYSDLRIIFRHLLPNVINVTLVYWMTDMALAILLGSSLGYLGLGAQPPAAEWGVLIAGGKNFMDTAWWITVFPGLAIVMTGLGFSLMGDALTEFLKSGNQ